MITSHVTELMLFILTGGPLPYWTWGKWIWPRDPETWGRLSHFTQTHINTRTPTPTPLLIVDRFSKLWRWRGKVPIRYCSSDQGGLWQVLIRKERIQSNSSVIRSDSAQKCVISKNRSRMFSSPNETEELNATRVISKLWGQAWWSGL